MQEVWNHDASLLRTEIYVHDYFSHAEDSLILIRAMCNTCGRKAFCSSSSSSNLTNFCLIYPGSVVLVGNAVAVRHPPRRPEAVVSGRPAGRGLHQPAAAAPAPGLRVQSEPLRAPAGRQLRIQIPREMIMMIDDSHY